MQRETIKANDLDFSILTAGDPAKPMILMLHGFPEYSGAWTEMMERLSDDYFCVAPDQRGYGGSARPQESAAYAIGPLVADALGVIAHYRPGGRVHAVFGHDWGAAVAYALAIGAPKLVERLIIANGVHPIPFQRALAKGGAQAAASQYIIHLREPTSHEALAANDFAGLLAVLNAKMDMSWMTEARLAEYKAAWGREGALKAMIDWYRATPLVVPAPGETVPADKVPQMPADKMRVKMPHLLIWGLGDTALLPESKEGLEDLCDDLTVKEIEEADHWVIHQKPDEVAAFVRGFLE